VGKPEEKQPFGRPKHRHKGKIKMDPHEIGSEGGEDYIVLVWDRAKRQALLNRVMNL
jgi:hypothetical protein